MDLIIGASVGGAIGALLLVSMVTIVIVMLLWCKVARKRPKKEQELDDGLYDVIQEVHMDTQGNKSLTSKQDVDMEDNEAYISTGVLAAMNTTSHERPSIEKESQLTNTYKATTTGGELTIGKNTVSNDDEDVDEYMHMAPLREMTSRDSDGIEYDYVRNF